MPTPDAAGAGAYGAPQPGGMPYPAAPPGGAPGGIGFGVRVNDKYNNNTVYSRYLKLGYLEFCKTRSVYLNQKYTLIAFSNHNLALKTFTSPNYPKYKLSCTSGNLNL